MSTVKRSFLLFFIFTGCHDLDAVPRLDATVSARDSGEHDDGGQDAEPQADVGTPDTGTTDTGTTDTGTTDVGTPDAGTPDTGTMDAGTTDAGTPDAGTCEVIYEPTMPTTVPHCDPSRDCFRFCTDANCIDKCLEAEPECAECYTTQGLRCAYEVCRDASHALSCCERNNGCLDTNCPDCAMERRAAWSCIIERASSSCERAIEECFD